MLRRPAVIQDCHDQLTRVNLNFGAAVSASILTTMVCKHAVTDLAKLLVVTHLAATLDVPSSCIPDTLSVVADHCNFDNCPIDYACCKLLCCKICTEGTLIRRKAGLMQHSHRGGGGCDGVGGQSRGQNRRCGGGICSGRGLMSRVCRCRWG